MLVLTRKEGQSIMLVSGGVVDWVLTLKSIQPTARQETVSFVVQDPNSPCGNIVDYAEEYYKIGEQFDVGQCVIVRVVSIENRGPSASRVRLGFSAPKTVEIFREEIWNKIKGRYK